MEYTETLMWKELNEAPDVLQTLKDKNAAVLKGIAAFVGAAGVDNVYTAARGTSDHAMIYFKYLAESLLGLPVASGAPGVFTLYGGKVNLKNSLVIGCSQSGRAEDVMEVLKAANASGGITVAITNDAASPLAKLAQFHLCCYAGEEKSVAATKTFSAQIFLSLLLVQALGGEIEANDLGKKLASELAEVGRATDGMAEDFIAVQECFVLARKRCS